MHGIGIALRSSGLRFLSVALLLVLGKAASAHPHEWIDLRVEFKFDEEKRLIALEQSWLFDPFFSAYVVEELNAERPRRNIVREQAQALGVEMVSNLNNYNLLNEWTYQGEEIPDLVGTFVSTQIKNRNQMELTFRIDLEMPLDLTAGPFEYRVFDPTYYIEILHADGFRPRLRGGPRGCKATIIEPDPSEDLLIYAAKLDRDENAEDGLGQHFAERVVIACAQ